MGRWSMAWTLVGAMMAASPAHAVDGVVWRWDPGVTRRYYLFTQVQPPYVLDFDAARNLDGRISAFSLAMLVDCARNEPARCTQASASAFSSASRPVSTSSST